VFETIGVAPGVTYATLDPATVTAVTLSGGNLTATNTGTTSNEQGAKVAAASAKTSGKYYFEAKFAAFSGSILRTTAGIGPPASTYTLVSSGATAGDVVSVGGVVHANGVGNVVDIYPPGTLPVSSTVGIAVNLDNRTIWFREAPSGLWNISATANPATNTEGLVVPAGSMVPYVTFGGTSGAAGCITTVNLGASAFVGAVPAGFTPGWPA